jgi:hypothetical protein
MDKNGNALPPPPLPTVHPRWRTISVEQRFVLRGFVV